MPCLSRFVLTLATALALTSLAGPRPASAGEYTVRQCDYAAGNGMHDFAWQSAGAPTVDPYAGSGCGEFGLAVRNSGGGTQRTYPSGAYGGWFAHAPTGTVFTAFSGVFGVLEGCCVNGMASYAEAAENPAGEGRRAYLFQGHLGNDSWYPPSGVRGPVGRSWSTATSGFAARRVGFHLRCGPGFSCAQGAYGDLRLRGRSFDFTLNDFAAPSVGEPSGTLVTGGWVRGVRTLAFSSADSGGGLTLMEAVFDSGQVQRWRASCTTVAGRYARLAPCPVRWSGEWAVDTARIPDGGHHLHLFAADAGGTQTQRTFPAYVDNGAPAAPLDAALVGGEGWRAANGFELRWTNPAGQHAPIVRARWRACPLAGAMTASGCVDGERGASGVTASGPIALPAAGEWEVRVWLEDLAGNADPGRSAVRQLRFDPDPPRLRFLPAEPAAPARVVVSSEDVSGVVDARVEVRPRGTAAWSTLPTEREEGRLIAVLDDQRRAGGAYELRALAVDRAGNAGSADGGLRTFTEDGDGSPSAGGNSPVPAAAPATDQRKASAPRPTPAARRPRAKVTMAARARRAAGRRSPTRRWGRSRRRIAVPGGRAVLFHGRVGGPLPRHGKLVEVQAYFRGRWRTISAARSRRDGRWRFRYTFSPTAWQASYRLRARVPVEGGYPFAAGVSRPVRVTVLPFPR